MLLILVFNLNIEHKKCSKCFLYNLVGPNHSKSSDKSCNLNKVTYLILVSQGTKHENLQEHNVNSAWVNLKRIKQHKCHGWYECKPEAYTTRVQVLNRFHYVYFKLVIPLVLSQVNIIKSVLDLPYQMGRVVKAKGIHHNEADCIEIVEEIYHVAQASIFVERSFSKSIKNLFFLIFKIKEILLKCYPHFFDLSSYPCIFI